MVFVGFGGFCWFWLVLLGFRWFWVVLNGLAWSCASSPKGMVGALSARWWFWWFLMVLVGFCWFWLVLVVLVGFG